MNTKEKSYKTILKYYVPVLLFLWAILFAILAIIESSSRSNQRELLKQHETQIVQLEQKMLAQEFDVILSDLFYLAETFDLESSKAKDAGEIASEWRVFSTHRGIYDQIRFIDESGNEKIRVNKTGQGAQIVDAAKLQNKKDRYYFYETVKLQEGQAYISKLDLNIENGLIETPLKPMIRFSTPLYNNNGQLYGIVVLNYSARFLLENFKEIAKSSMGELFLLNHEGYYLSSRDEKTEWGFMYPDKKEISFANSFANEWSGMQAENGAIGTGNGFFEFSSVKIKDALTSFSNGLSAERILVGDGSWVIVSYVNAQGPNGYLVNDSFAQVVKKVTAKHALLFVLLALVSFLISILIAYNNRSLQKIKFFSQYDSLTKIYNRRAGLALLNENVPNNRRKCKTCICFLDIDGLKEVNDHFGHENGDTLILDVVRVIQATIRQDDIFMRLGGDEFLIAFMQIGIEEAETIWARIAAAYNEINERESRPYIISVSHGIVAHVTQDEGIDQLIGMADQKMYEEKRELKKTLKVIRE